MDEDNSDLVWQRLSEIAQFLTASIGLIVVIMIIVGALQYTTAGGDPQKVSAAKQRIGRALGAILMLVFSTSVLNWVIPGGIL